MGYLYFAGYVDCKPEKKVPSLNFGKDSRVREEE